MTNLKMKISGDKDIYIKSAGPEIYQEASEFLKETFGENSRGYKTIMGISEGIAGIDPEKATGASLPFNIAIQKILPYGERIASLDDLTMIYANNLSFSDGADTTDVLLYSHILSRTQSLFGQDSKILEDLTRLVKNEKFDKENPLRISGLGIASDDNCYGFKFTNTENTKMVNDPRFAFSNNGKEVDFGYTNIKVGTNHKNGLSKLSADRGGDLSALSDFAYPHYDQQVIVCTEGFEL